MPITGPVGRSTRVQTAGCAGVESIAAEMHIAKKIPPLLSFINQRLPWIIGVGIGLALLLAAIISVLTGRAAQHRAHHLCSRGRADL